MVADVVAVAVAVLAVAAAGNFVETVEDPTGSTLDYLACQPRLQMINL